MSAEIEIKKDLEGIYGTIRELLEQIAEGRTKEKGGQDCDMLESMETRLADAAAVLQKDIFTCDATMTWKKIDTGEENR